MQTSQISINAVAPVRTSVAYLVTYLLAFAKNPQQSREQRGHAFITADVVATISEFSDMQHPAALAVCILQGILAYPRTAAFSPCICHIEISALQRH